MIDYETITFMGEEYEPTTRTKTNRAQVNGASAKLDDALLDLNRAVNLLQSVYGVPAMQGYAVVIDSLANTVDELRSRIEDAYCDFECDNVMDTGFFKKESEGDA